MADGLLNKASIILTPTGYKAGTLYNVAPIDEPYEDFDFARTSTATRINSSGLVSNVATGVPRINYDSNGENGHILLEPTSTNLVPYSEDFSQWTEGSNTTLTYESDVVAPDGSLGVYRLQNPQSGSTFLTIGVINCRNFSLFVKAVTAGVNNQFNLDASGQPTDTKTATTQWQRYDRDFGSQANYNLSINNGIDNYASDIYIWGAQAEALPYATSYIPTLTGSQEVRATETATGAGSADLINSTEGVLYAEIAALADDNTYRVLSLSDGTTNERVYMQYTNASNTVSVVVKDGGVTQANMVYVLSDATNFSKVAIKYKSNDFALWVDGVERATDTSGNTPTGLNTLAFNSGGSAVFYGKVKALAVFNEALSDSELTQLTT